MKHLYCGIFAMALIIGLLTGVSASPVVAVIIPLLFSAVTAGGAVYAFNASDNVAASRKKFLGINALLFSGAFVAGLWLGVAAKFNPKTIWPGIKEPLYVYSELGTTDATLLVALIEIERRMIGVGTGAQRRKEILTRIVESINKRRSKDGTLDPYDRRMLEKVALPEALDPTVPMFPVANNPRKDFSDWVQG